MTLIAKIHELSCRSDIAWKNANYAQIWEYLWDEYELTQRFGNLHYKLKFVAVNLVPIIFASSRISFRIGRMFFWRG
ncbi:hypothetical protein B296_00022818 [Ensete ventricosum]|uniref:Uncharacterized protein n=1 Tax=Ensete ventricosum TaxID=4639 RepID=A0A426YD39_ENSVE|nr:hypothetical protein B296_00022818 [Ensete ventricosum]